MKKQGSRTEYAAKNALLSTACQIVNMLVTFVGRRFFTEFLGNNYLSVNGLFTNVLTMLSLAELGVGTAIIFNMYKPIAEGNAEKVKSLMKLYRYAYWTIGCVVAFIGLCLVPFLDVLVGEKPKGVTEPLTLLYLLFLGNSVVSYFFSYKRSIILANQKNYITSLTYQGYHILQIVVQTAILYLTRSFVLYLVAHILFTFLDNLTCSLLADRMYPELRDKNVKPLGKDERRGIFRNVRALMLYKVSSVILHGSDNIMISLIPVLGLLKVGIVSNYTLITTAFRTLLGSVISSFSGSIGNLNATADVKRKEIIFDRVFFFGFWLYGFCCSGLTYFFSDFIRLWLGDTQYVAHWTVGLALALDLYVMNVHNAAYTYRTTMGYFVQGKFAPVAQTVVNIGCTVGLVYLFQAIWGNSDISLSAVFFATTISRWTTVGIVDPWLIYKKGFNKSPAPYFIKYVLYLVFVVGSYFVCRVILVNTVERLFNPSTLGGFIIDVLCYSVIYNLLFALVFSRTDEFKGLWRMAGRLMGKVTGKIFKRKKSEKPLDKMPQE